MNGNVYTFEHDAYRDVLLFRTLAVLKVTACGTFELIKAQYIAFRMYRLPFDAVAFRVRFSLGDHIRGALKIRFGSMFKHYLTFPNRCIRHARANT